MTDLSIIIISYNTKDITKKCLETVINSLEIGEDIKAEIIVLDNASADGSIEMLRELKDLLRVSRFTLHVIESKENLGYAKGNNTAAKQAKGSYLLFLNSDTEALDDAIPRHYNLFKSYETLFDFAGAKLLNSDRTPQPSAGRFYTLPIAFLALLAGGDYWGISRSSPKKITKTDWVSGACFITTKKIYDEVGGFDESIFMYWDEVDFFYRAHKKGMSVCFFPEPQYIHLEGASSESRTQPILNVYKGYVYFYKKHYSHLHLILLKYMLKLKAVISMTIGYLIGNEYLKQTYSEAYEITKKI